MSKASEWSENLKKVKREKPNQFIVFEYTTTSGPQVIEVDELGRLQFSKTSLVPLESKRALELADWIKETFGESNEPS